MKIQITTGDVARSYSAATGQEAIQLFFDQVRAGEIKVADLGFIGEWTDGQESYPFRIMPALYKAGVITWSQMENLHKLAELNFNPSELLEMAALDAWMVRSDNDVKEISSIQ